MLGEWGCSAGGERHYNRNQSIYSRCLPPGRVAVLDKVTDFLLFLGKLLISGSVGEFIFYLDACNKLFIYLFNLHHYKLTLHPSRWLTWIWRTLILLHFIRAYILNVNLDSRSYSNLYLQCLKGLIAWPNHLFCFSSFLYLQVLYCKPSVYHETLVSSSTHSCLICFKADEDLTIFVYFKWCKKIYICLLLNQIFFFSGILAFFFFSRKIPFFQEEVPSLNYIWVPLLVRN